MKIYTKRNLLIGTVFAVIVCIGMYFVLHKSTAQNSGKVAQVDTAAFNGSVITKEAPLNSKVKKGQVILKLNPEQYEAQLKVDKAKMMDDIQKLNRDKMLDQQCPNGAISEEDLASAKYAVVEDYQSIKLDDQYVRECTIHAPFDGTVTNIVNYPGSGVGNGNEIMDITAG